MTQPVAPSPSTLRPTLVDRDDELVQLRRRLADAAHGSGSIILLAAEAGVGKTRMVEEVSAHCQSTIDGRPPRRSGRG